MLIDAADVFEAAPGAVEVSFWMALVVRACKVSASIFTRGSRPAGTADGIDVGVVVGFVPAIGFAFHRRLSLAGGLT